MKNLFLQALNFFRDCVSLGKMKKNCKAYFWAINAASPKI